LLDPGVEGWNDDRSEGGAHVLVVVEVVVQQSLEAFPVVLWTSSSGNKTATGAHDPKNVLFSMQTAS